MLPLIAATAGLGLLAVAIFVEFVDSGGPPRFGWEQLVVLFLGAFLLGRAAAAALHRAMPIERLPRAGVTVLAAVAAGAGIVLLAAGVLFDRSAAAGYSGLGWKQAAAVGAGAAAIGGSAVLGWLSLRSDRGSPSRAAGAQGEDVGEARLSRLLRGSEDGARVSSAPIVSRVVVAIYAAVLAIRLQPNVLLDDAAITFRYVERLTAGLGFTYNDHEHVLGASNPLYTLLLAGLDLVGLDPESGARVLGVFVFVGVALLALDLAEKMSNWVGGLIAGLLLPLEPHFRSMALSGMESGLAVLLGLGAVAALIRRREVLAGVLLGLAIWNKIDAGLLALAIAGVMLLVQRRFPIKIAAAATLTVLPWAIFATLYYGSPLPHSFVAKTGHEELGISTFDQLWIVKFFASEYRWLWVALGVAAAPFLLRLPTKLRTGGFVLLGWFGLHAVGFSVVNLGDGYPWYLTVLIPPLVVLAAVLLASLPTLARTSVVGALVVVGTAAVLTVSAPGFSSAAAGLAGGPPLEAFDAFDGDRHLSGLFVRRYAKSNEIVNSGFGWVAYGAIDNPHNDNTLLNSEVALRPEAYVIALGRPYDSGYNVPKGPDGYVELANFNLASDLEPGYSWFSVYGRPDSAIARSGKRYIQRRLFQLAPPKPYSGRLGLEGISIRGNDLSASAPSGATFTVRNDGQPVHVVFSPQVEKRRSARAEFELRALDRPLYRAPIGTSESRRARRSPIKREVPGARGRREVDLSFLSLPRAGDRAVWSNAKVVIGDATVDLDQLYSKRLATALARRNPSTEARGATAQR